MFNNNIKSDKIDDWKCVYETSIESEARLVKAFLQNEDITCEILSKKDSAYTVNFGDLSAIFLYVPVTQADKAESMINDWKEGKIEFGNVEDPNKDGDDEEDNEDNHS